MVPPLHCLHSACCHVDKEKKLTQPDEPRVTHTPQMLILLFATTWKNFKDFIIRHKLMYSMTPLRFGTQSGKIHKNKNLNGGCHGQLLFNRQHFNLGRLEVDRGGG